MHFFLHFFAKKFAKHNLFIVSLQSDFGNDMIMYRSRSGWSRNGRVAFSNQSAQMSLGDIKAADAIYVGATLPAAPSVRKQKSIAFSMLSPKIKIVWGPQ